MSGPFKTCPNCERISEVSERAAEASDAKLLAAEKERDNKDHLLRVWQAAFCEASDEATAAEKRVKELEVDLEWARAAATEHNTHWRVLQTAERERDEYRAAWDRECNRALDLEAALRKIADEAADLIQAKHIATSALAGVKTR